MAQEESGAGFYGALSGYIFIILICIWLIYAEQIRAKFNSRHINKNTPEKKSYTTMDSLNTLKENGLINNNEYKEKIKIIEESEINEQIYSSDEYLQLKNLLGKKIFSEEEFKNKVAILFSKKKESYNFNLNGKTDFSNFSATDFLGSWKFDEGFLDFENTNDLNFKIYYKFEYKDSWNFKPYDGIIGLNNEKSIENIKIIMLSDMSLEFLFQDIVYMAKKVR